MATTQQGIHIDRLYIPTKETGSQLTAVEFNKVPAKVNEIINVLNNSDTHVRDIIAQEVTNDNNIQVMTTQEYLSLPTRDTRIIYICVDEGTMTSVNAGDFTIASIQGQALIKGFAYSLPIIL